MNGSLIQRLVFGMMYGYAKMMPVHRGRWRIMLKLERLFGIDNLCLPTIETKVRGHIWTLDLQCYNDRRLFFDGIHDPAETACFTALCREDSVIFDIGANLGWYTLNASRRALTGKIYAFEPQHQVFQKLQQNCTANKADNVMPIQSCLGASAGHVMMSKFDPRHSGRTHIVESEAGYCASTIPITTLDRFCNEHRISHINLIKLDVEGYEPQVLAGGQSVIQNSQPLILLELNPTALAGAKSSREELLDILHDFSYKLYAIGKTSLTRVSAPDIRPSDYVNVLAVPLSSTVQALNISFTKFAALYNAE